MLYQNSNFFHAFKPKIVDIIPEYTNRSKQYQHPTTLQPLDKKNDLCYENKEKAMLRNKSNNSAKILVLLTTNVAQLILLLGLASILISVLSSGIYQEFFNKIGTILIPTGLISFVFNHMLRMTFLEEMHNQIIDAIQYIYPNVKEIKNSGIQKVHDNFPTSQVEVAMSTAEKIFIFTTFLPDFQTLSNAISKAVNNKCKIKILLLCPMSKLAENRNRDFNGTVNEVSNGIERDIEFFSEICKENDHNSNLEVRIYKYNTPTLLFFAYDDVIIFSPYLHKPGFNSPHIEVRGNKCLLYKKLSEHFKHVWNNAISMTDCLEIKGSECYKECVVKHGDIYASIKKDKIQ